MKVKLSFHNAKCGGEVNVPLSVQHVFVEIGTE